MDRPAVAVGNLGDLHDWINALFAGDEVAADRGDGFDDIPAGGSGFRVDFVNFDRVVAPLHGYGASARAEKRPAQMAPGVCTHKNTPRHAGSFEARRRTLRPSAV
jgi:hypothetical protein